MQENDPNQILNELKKLRLSASEKSRVRANLIMRMKLNAPEKSNFAMIFSSMVLRPLAAALVVIVFISGGVAIAAENTLPGDLLYPLKINVNEEVRGAMLATLDARADWEMVRAERRLEEAEQLLAEGRLDAATAAEIGARFEGQAQTVSRAIEASSTAPQTVANLHDIFEAKLRAHEQILGNLKNNNDQKAQEEMTAQADQIDNLVLKVRTKSQQTAEIRARQEQKLTERSKPEMQVQAETQMRLAGNKLGSLKGLINRSDDREEAEAKLGSAFEAYGQGQYKFANNDYAGAYALFSQSLRDAQELETLLSVSTKLRLRFGGVGGGPDSD